LPGKNIKILAGKPLIAYTIEAALHSDCISEIIVSTDDEAIAKIALENGASIPFLRPAALASDTASAIDTYLYTIDRIEEERKQKIDSIIVLLPTSPLRKSDDVMEAYRLFIDRNADSVISFTPEHHPVSWHKQIDAGQRFIDVTSDGLANRQELGKTYFPNGAIYIFKTALLRKREYYSENSFAYIMPRNRSVDIDTIEDFEYADFLMQRQQGNV